MTDTESEIVTKFMSSEPPRYSFYATVFSDAVKSELSNEYHFIRKTSLRLQSSEDVSSSILTNRVTRSCTNKKILFVRQQRFVYCKMVCHSSGFFTRELLQQVACVKFCEKYKFLLSLCRLCSNLSKREGKRFDCILLFKLCDRLRIQSQA